MKKLCLGTFLTIICQARIPSVSQKAFIGALLRCVDADTSYLDEDDGRQGHLKNGRDNIPSYYAEAILAANPEDIYNYFEREIRPMLASTLEKQVILAFRNVIAEDTDIADTVKLGPVEGYKKSDILSKNTFSYMGLLTNLYIYCVTQVENKPYQENIKEIDKKTFVASFVGLIDTIQIDEKILTVPTELTETAKKRSFEEVFTEIKHPNTLSLVNPSQVRIYYLNVGDYAFDYTRLSKFIKANIGRYVFSRAKRNEYAVNEDLESLALDASASLKKRGADLTDAHFAEIMLYSFLECALGAPKIMSKIELQNIGGEYRSKSSGIHLLTMPGTTAPIHQLVFGSTDILSDLNGAIDSAFAQIVEIKSSAADEHTLVEANILNNSFSPEVTTFLKETIIPRPGSPKRPSTAFGVFLGYNVDVPDVEKIPSEEYISAMIKKMQADISACVPYIQNKITEFKLSMHSFYIYVLPLDDVNKDRTSIMNKALGG